MDNKEFCESKKAYTRCREEERRRIIDFIAEKKDAHGNPLFSKITERDYSKYKYSGGCGLSTYGKKRTKPLTPPYDLSNWKYIETSYKGQYLMISLQCFDIDPNTGSKNIHILFDRIGVLFEKPEKIKIGNDLISDAFLRMKITGFELPLTDSEIKQLIDWIIESIESKI